MGMSSRAPAVEKVLSDIREKIIFNQFEAEQPLSESMLAEMYEVSRGSIRSAIQMLESEGLIIVGDNGRKTPARITEKFTSDLYETRIMLETEAIKICMNKSEVDSSIIATAFADFYKLYSYSGEELYILRSQINTSFHRAILRMADNIPLLKCWDTIEPLIYCIAKFNYITLAERQTNDELIKTHQLLMDLILKKDKRAFDVTRSHIKLAVDETNMGLEENK